jgi:hypothetical protein
MSGGMKAAIGIIVVLVVVVIAVVALAVTGVIGPGTAEPTVPPDTGLFSCAEVYLPTDALGTGPAVAGYTTYTFTDRSLVYVPTGSTGATGTYYYLTAIKNDDTAKSVVLTNTATNEWSLSPEGRLISSKVPDRCLQFSPGSSVVTLTPTSVCDAATENAGGVPDVACAFAYDGYSLYARYSLENPSQISAFLLYWYNTREALSLEQVQKSGVGSTINCSNIGVA